MVIDGSLQHGGFVDRLKGIVSFYALARKLGWRFQIHYTQPFSLGDFFQEGTVKWNCAFIKKTWPAARPIWLFDQSWVDLPRLVKRLDRGGMYHVYSNIDFVSQVYPDIQKSEYGAFWGSLFRELFVVRGQVKQELAPVFKPTHRIGFHLRFTNLLGDFSDTGRVSISTADQERLMDNCLSAIQLKLNERAESTPYLFTDSPRFIRAAQQQFANLQVIPGMPVHTDLQSPAKGGDNHKKTVLDFLALTGMHHIYFIKSNVMYNSKFSRYAAWVGGCTWEPVTL
ncbi:MAG: hypothetical protein JNL17_01525 [Cyclobacteriaceae bacterium]|nr:hypothetical protein [Cyclobacteriaceae bacterium]